MTFTIKRSKWWRGKGIDSSLLRKHGPKQCCTGQVCTALGVPNKALRGNGVVGDLDYYAPEITPLKGVLLLRSPSSYAGLKEAAWVTAAYGINDDVNITDQVRERKLKAIAKRGRHQLVFID